MTDALSELIGRLGPIRGIDRVSSGSPARLLLWIHVARHAVRAIDATNALARRGPSLLQAKHKIEELIERGSVIVDLSTVEDIQKLTAELALAGVTAVCLTKETDNAV